MNQENVVAELFGNQHGNLDYLSDLEDISKEVRHGMWALVPNNVGDGLGLVNEVRFGGLSEKFIKQIAEKTREKLGFNELNYIDSGAFGVAFDVGDDLVMKITTDHTEVVEANKLLNKKNNHIADHYEIYKISSKSVEMHKDIYVIILEKLTTDKPKFQKYIRELDKILLETNHSDLSNVFYDLIKYGDEEFLNAYDFRKYLTENREVADFFYGLVGIADELESLGIGSMEFLAPTNLGYKRNGALAFFDVGFSDYFQDVPKSIKSVDVDENFAGGGGNKYTRYDDVSGDGLPVRNNISTAPSIRNNLDANSALYDEQFIEGLYYRRASDATADEYVIGENIQKMDKEFVKSGYFTEEDRQNVLDITGGDNYTYDVAKMYDFYMQITNPNMDRADNKHYQSYVKDPLTERYNELRNYDKNIIPIKDKENLHGIDLATALKHREYVVKFLRSIPSIYLRNLKEDIRTPRTSMELELGRLLKEYIPTIKKQLSLIHKLSDDKKDKILSKVFSSKNNTFERVAEQMRNLDVLFLHHDDEMDELKSKVEYQEEDAEILYEKDGIAVVDVRSSDAMKTLGCGSQWCFSTEHGDSDWINYANDGNVNIIYNFNKKPDSKKRMVVLLPTDEVYNMYDELMDDGWEYLSSLGVDKYINVNKLEPSEMDERKLAWMPGSQSVEVKQKCRLAGLGTTSKACNQGDITNLKFKPLSEKEGKTELGISYTAVILDDKSTERLLRKVEQLIPDNWDVVKPFEMIIREGEILPEMSRFLGLNIPLQVVKYAITDNILAVMVDGIPSEYKVPCIVIANKGLGFDSKNLTEVASNITDWTELKRPLRVSGKIIEIPYTLE